MLNDCLEFWTKHAPDKKYGGFLTSLDRDGTVVDTDKGIWQQGRFCWLLGELYNNFEPRTQWLDLLHHGIQFLDEFGFDAADGRMWFQVSRSGIPIRKRRYSFSESFAAIAYGQYARATGQSRYANKAKKLFEQFLHHHSHWIDPQPKFTPHRATRSIGYPMIAINTAQELRQSIRLETATEQIDRHLEMIIRYHLNPKRECVIETVGHGGEILDSFDGRTLNPGHAIEAAWFIMNEGRYRDDDALVKIGCEMLDWMWERGWDKAFGGMLYFVSIDDRPIQEYWHDMKFWWPHNETIMATLLAYLLTGNDKYKRWHEQVHRWAYSHFADAEFGEWFGYLRRDGSLSSRLKGNLWKGPFHLPRMQWYCWKWLEEYSITNGVDNAK